MSVQVLLPYGGDFSLTSTGDIALVADSGGQWLATQQKIIQMILTSAQLLDANNNPVPGSADDIFNAAQGVGARRVVGNVENTALINQIEANIFAGLATFPDVVMSPQPNIVFTVYPNGVVINLTVTLINGQTIALPPVPVTPSGS